MTNEGNVVSRLVPSGARRDTASVAILPPAPGRLSTIIVRPCVRLIWSASRRTRKSKPPPGGTGTTILIVFGACDHALPPVGRTVESSAAAPAATYRNLRRGCFILPSQSGVVRDDSSECVLRLKCDHSSLAPFWCRLDYN